MIVYYGKCVFGGVAIGRIHQYERKKPSVIRRAITDPQAETERFLRAKEQARAQLTALYERAVREAGEAGAAIFRAHRMLLDDENFAESVEKIIRMQRLNAEYAVAAAGESFSEMFASMEDEYMGARAADVRDVSQRVLAALGGKRPDDSGQTASGPVILLADDLTPSETVQLEKEKIVSFVTVRGSVNSHTAILARTMGIPALVGTEISEELPVLEGRLGIVDGSCGALYIDPDEETLAAMRKKQVKEREERRRLQPLRGKETVTQDGQRVMLYANIDDGRELAAALENGAEGIGLFRSEFLYVGRNSYPTEEEQFQAYKAAAEAMEGKRVVIRTLDIGADKQALYFGLEKEANPALGLRGIRICLTHPDLFRTQLRAIFRAGAYGRLAVMYPMITSVEEVRRIRGFAETVRNGLREEDIPFGEVEQGILIETPAAAIVSDLLAREVDFFSIGTNDLTQYLLAADRQNGALDAFYDARHPAVLRMIRQTVEHAHQAGIRCGICGELAADRALTETFVRMGVDALSVSPGNILPLRKLIREMKTGETSSRRGSTPADRSARLPKGRG